MHQHMGQILVGLVVGVVALIVTRCGGSDVVDDEMVAAAELAAVAAIETTTTTVPESTTTTTTIPKTTTTAAVAPVLETEDPEEIAYCLATLLVDDVIASGVRGEIKRVRAAIELRSSVIRSIDAPAEIEEEIEITLDTADALSQLLADPDRTIEEKHDELVVLVTDEAYVSSAHSIAAFERDVCKIT